VIAQPAHNVRQQINCFKEESSTLLVPWVCIAAEVVEILTCAIGARGMGMRGIMAASSHACTIACCTLLPILFMCQALCMLLSVHSVHLISGGWRQRWPFGEVSFRFASHCKLSRRNTKTLSVKACVTLAKDTILYFNYMFFTV
jgi:hypothetical protein